MNFGIENDELCVLKMMNFAFKMMNSVLKLFKKYDFDGNGQVRSSFAFTFRSLSLPLPLYSNCNGQLDAEEFADALQSIGLTMSEVEIALLMAHLDGDKNGTISIDEFVHWILDTQLKHVQMKLRAAAYTYGGVNLPALFKHYDRDNSGQLDFDEFRQVVRWDAQLGSSAVADSELKTLFDSADRNANGSIDLAEFVALLSPETAAIRSQAKERFSSQAGQVYSRILAKAEVILDTLNDHKKRIMFQPKRIVVQQKPHHVSTKTDRCSTKHASGAPHLPGAADGDLQSVRGQTDSRADWVGV